MLVVSPWRKGGYVCSETLDHTPILRFHVTSNNRADGPWTYTTEAGRTLRDTWNSAYSAGSYDLTVHGPNGFVRVFKGANSMAGSRSSPATGATTSS